MNFANVNMMTVFLLKPSDVKSQHLAWSAFAFLGVCPSIFLLCLTALMPEFLYFAFILTRILFPELVPFCSNAYDPGRPSLDSVPLLLLSPFSSIYIA